jgi:hypothetical protein
MKPARHLSVFASVLRHTLAGVAIVLLPGSCGPAYLAPPVTRELAQVSRVPKSLLERGYIIHQEKCAKCHPFEDPAKYEVAELTHEIMPEMRRKSKIDSADEQAVLAYLIAARQLGSQAPGAGAPVP